MPPYGGDMPLRLAPNRPEGFQSMPPYGGDRTFCRDSQEKLIFQSMPPYGGDFDGPDVGGVFRISIHAPIRGRLLLLAPLSLLASISIHAPIRGRPFPSDEVGAVIPISIHAPIRGRPMTVDNISFLLILIHAPIRGRHPTCVGGVHVGQFQSMPPYGGDGVVRR